MGWGERGKWREGDRPKAESGRLKAEGSREWGVKEQRGRGEEGKGKKGVEPTCERPKASFSLGEWERSGCWVLSDHKTNLKGQVILSASEIRKLPKAVINAL